MGTRQIGRADTAHHHPHVVRALSGTWRWQCDCGGASCRTALAQVSWREAVIGALNHATCLAP
ncbi:hypothetical protein SAMN04489867_1079 [Pedococcus dokdonensis]|uniref:Uncharacterized protein n=1 Tax=Pedococcus dokdonensis TaxID=443156 RepID=A0A1H0NYA1_9MICO|nr:hypothetical protein [Pedococcus dokdonensis]SDO97641.1 hypothetical protein SAMN04489867_1079 [Pedococcus dokdonensis]